MKEWYTEQQLAELQLEYPYYKRIVSKVHLSIVMNYEYIKIRLQMVVTFQDYSQKSIQPIFKLNDRNHATNPKAGLGTRAHMIKEKVSFLMQRKVDLECISSVLLANKLPHHLLSHNLFESSGNGLPGCFCSRSLMKLQSTLPRLLPCEGLNMARGSTSNMAHSHGS